jgi:hypothetical protein
VKTAGLRKLRVNILMTGQALTGLVALKRLVAVTALCFKIRVGMKIIQFDPGSAFGTDRSGVKNCPSLKPQGGPQDNYDEDRKNNAGPRK